MHRSSKIAIAAVASAAIACGGAVSNGKGGGDAGADKIPGSGSGGASGAGANLSARLARLDIGDARTLFIAKSGTTSPLAFGARPSADGAAGSSGTPTTATPGNPVPILYKVTDDGRIVEVSRAWVGADGQPVSETGSVTPACVWNASSTYVVVNYWSSMSMPFSALTRKSDGAVFVSSASALNELICPSTSGASGSPLSSATAPLQADGAGNLYVLKRNAVYEIDVTDPSVISEVRVTPETDYVWSFVVNASGDLYYTGNVGSAAGTGVWRFRSAAGSLMNSTSTESIWTGLDGKFYRLRSAGAMGPSGGTTDLVRVEIGSGVTETTVATWPFTLWSSPVRLGDSLVWLPGVSLSTYPGMGGAPAVVQLTAMDQEPGVFPLPSSMFRTLAFGPSSIWFLGADGSALTRWTASATTPIAIDGAYDIYALGVSEDDSATINALRMADGRKIVASVDAAGGVTIADVGASPEVIVFQRID
jgi:hypothetical protein